MPGSELPQLVEIKPGLLEWAFYGATPLRSRMTAFLCIAGFGWTLLAIFGVGALVQGNLNALALAALGMSFVVWTSAWAFICFCSVVHQADAVERQIRRSVYVFGKPLYTRTKIVRDGDAIVMWAFRDRETGGAQHRVYLQRNGTYRLLGHFQLLSEQPSRELLAMFDRIAEHLSVRNDGYIQGRRLLLSWLTHFRFTDR